jgi:hypothetical protein
MACKHAEFEIVSRVAHVEDVGRYVLEMKIHCKGCNTPFQFLGVAPGFTYEHPTVRLDGLEIDLPICPQGARPSPLQGLMGYTIKGTN